MKFRTTGKQQTGRTEGGETEAKNRKRKKTEEAEKQKKQKNRRSRKTEEAKKQKLYSCRKKEKALFFGEKVAKAHHNVEFSSLFVHSTARNPEIFSATCRKDGKTRTKSRFCKTSKFFGNTYLRARTRRCFT